MIELIIYYDGSSCTIRNLSQDKTIDIGPHVRDIDWRSVRFPEQPSLSYYQMQDQSNPATLIGKRVTLSFDGSNQEGIVQAIGEHSITIHKIKNDILTGNIIRFNRDNTEYIVFTEECIPLTAGSRLNFISPHIHWRPFCHVEIGGKNLSYSLLADIKYDSHERKIHANNIKLLAGSLSELSPENTIPLESKFSYILGNKDHNYEKTLRHQNSFVLEKNNTSYNRIIILDLNRRKSFLHYQFISIIDIPDCLWYIFNEHNVIATTSLPVINNNSVVNIPVGTTNSVLLNNFSVTMTSKNYYPALDTLEIKKDPILSEKIEIYDKNGQVVVSEKIGEEMDLNFEIVDCTFYLELINNTSEVISLDITYEVDFPILELLSNKCQAEGQTIKWSYTIAPEQKKKYMRKISLLRFKQE